ncbi:MAG: ATP-dependent DNA helicase, partial [Propionibacterium sp.]|nr:ATP-dependent DNA helicase [Propionibacterium sp.]
MSEDVPRAEVARRVLSRVVTSMGGSARPGQERMVDEVAAAITGHSHVMVQAGTGTGKSLGYLVPVLTDCAENDHRALVTTATLALQRQILVKDAPAVVDAVEAELGVRPAVALLKGWSNYVCLHRIGGGASGPTLLDVAEAGPVTDLGQEILRVREWAGDTETGDRDDLTPGVSDRAWHQVSVSKRECLGRSCPMLQECFPQAARDRAAAADLVVSNHSLLGIHATGGLDLFPDIDVVVVDEAHELADRVRDQASVEVSQGLVQRVARSAKTHAKVPVEALEQAGAAVGVVISSLEEGLLLQRTERLIAAVSALDSAVRQALSAVGNSSVDQSEKLLAKAALEELGAAMDAWDRDPTQSITWVSRNEREGTQQLVIAPLDVAGPIGAVGLGERPAVLTSATLALGGSFDAMARETGLMVSKSPWHGVDVGTPFDTASQGILYVARHLPDPGPGGPGPEALAELVDLSRASGGGVLALFSSWRGAQAGAEALREGTDLEVLVQGEETVSALVQRFRDHRDSCLVGTMSLWQGVDVVGSSCRLVVIDRIPFPHPHNPVAKARAIDAERHGYGGFRAVHLTHAALLMAQGAGRLLRSTEDRGMVAVLDRRLLTKGYGSFIRASMPSMWPTTD